MDDYARLHDLEDLLDPSPVSPSACLVDIDQLRRICAEGIPDEPSWIRPRAWKLLLSLLPPDKRQWEVEAERSRTRYWALVDGIAEEIASRPDPLPNHTLSQPDRSLSALGSALCLQAASAQTLAGLTPSPLIAVSGPGSPGSPPEPFLPSRPRFHQSSSQSSSSILLSRVARIAASESAAGIEAGTSSAPPALTISTPEDNYTSPSAGPYNDVVNNKPALPLLSPTIRAAVPKSTSSERRSTCLLRMLHTHIRLHPRHPPIPHLITLTQALYSLCYSSYYPAGLDSDSESDEEAIAETSEWEQDAECDAFWFLESIRDFVGEVWEGREAMDDMLRNLSHRLDRIDEAFASELRRKSLDPLFSNYAANWLSSLLSSSLPPVSLYPVYDALFSVPHSLFLSNLGDVLLALIVLLRPHLFAAGRARGQAKTVNLWSGEEGMENEEVGKREGEAMLERYPVDNIGLGRIMRTATELKSQREWEESPSRAVWAGDVLKSRIWGAPDGKNSNRGVVKGMKGLAEVMKQSDAAASLAKVSTNWRAAAMQAWSSAGATSQPAQISVLTSPTSPWGTATKTVLGGLQGMGSPTSNGTSRSSSADSPISRSSPSSPGSRPVSGSPTDNYYSYSTPRSSRPLSPPASGRSLSTFQSALTSLIKTTPSLPSPPQTQRSLPRPLVLSSAARPSVGTRSSSRNRQDSVSSIASSSKHTAVSAASDSDGGIVRLRPISGRATISPRSPAGLALMQKFEQAAASRQQRMGLMAPSPSRSTSHDSSPAEVASRVLLSTPPAAGRVSPPVHESLQRGTLGDAPVSSMVSRSSSTSSLGSADDPISPPPRRSRRTAEKKPPNLRLRDSAAVPGSPRHSSFPQSLSSPTSIPTGNSLLPSTRSEGSKGLSSPLTPTTNVRSVSPRKGGKRLPETVLSEEEGVKADDEDNGYGDLLSAYEDEER